MKIALILVLFVLSTEIYASEIVNKKSSQRLQSKISSLSAFSDTTLTLWLTLDLEQVEKVPVLLSEESLRTSKKS